MRRLLPLALTLCLLAPSLARAQASETKKYLNAAITLFENLEYEKALKQVQKARTKATTPDDDARCSLLEGVVLADMGREEHALASFKAGFSIDPDAKLPVEVSPKVSTLAEKARANVKKVLAPQLEAARAEEEARRKAEDQRRAEEEARRVAELKRREDEEHQRNIQPPPAVVAPAPHPGPSLRALSWIPGVVGLASAGVATGLLVSASGRYQSLVKGTVAPGDALTARDAGKQEAMLGYVFTGVAVAGIAAAVTMFAVGGEPSAAPQVTVAPIPGGAFASVHVAF
jgi:tetratricopeptide (TPR) repeat protein